METLKQPAQTPYKVNTPQSWRKMISLLEKASGPVAIDAERAQSFRYLDKAYLIQLRRADAGTFIIDPIAFETDSNVADFSQLARTIIQEEWILHAASQDLGNLVALQMKPKKLFDTELAGRLLGFPRVGLASMIEHYFDLHLLKSHSADDWSKRPIPDDWISYAALDVELLIELREKLLVDLDKNGKTEWARQEFDYLTRWVTSPQPAQPEPWRRTSGTHAVTTRRGMAVLRQLWLTRDEIAKRLDKSPHKVLVDNAISELASLIRSDKGSVPTIRQIRKIDGFKRRQALKHMDSWVNALQQAASLDVADLPELRRRGNGLSHPRKWSYISPEAAQRWQVIRPMIIIKAEELNLPVENLISPAALRETLWAPEKDLDAQLAGLSARAWQREIIVPIIEQGLAEIR